MASLAYQGDLNYNGSDTLTVLSTDSDGTPLSDSDDIAITVSSINNAPVNTVPGAQTVDEDTSISITGISVNDVDGNLATTQLTVTNGNLNVDLTGGATISGGANDSSTLTLSGSQTQINAALASLAYQGDLNYNGSDTLTVLSTDSDGTPLSDSDDVAITVNAINDAPVNTVPTTATVNEDTALAMTGANLISVTDVDGNLASTQLTVGNGTLSVTLSGAATISAGASGTNTLTISGSEADINATLASLIYQGTSNFTGTDTLTKVSTDSAGTPLSDTDATIITVSSVNDAGTFAGNVSATTNEDTATAGTVTFTDTADGFTTPNFSINTAATNGIAAIDAAGNWTYTPTANYNGADSFTVQVTDDDGNVETQVISITVTQINDAGTFAGNVSATTNEDTATAGTVTFSDTADGFTTPNFSINTAATNGAAAIDAAGNWTYTPGSNYNGADSFTVQVTDDDGNVETQVISITVTAVNDAPVLGAIGNQSVDELVNLSFTATATDSDLLVDILTFSLDAASLAAGMTIDANTGVFSWTPTEAQGGTSPSVTITVTDSGTGNLIDSETFTITVAEVNIAPVLTGANDLSSITEDDISNAGTLVSDLIIGHFSDADGISSSGIAVVGTDNGNGSWEYTIDGGSNWLAFGSPSSGFARLLAADANTLVRFVPSADYNGTITNGITFHAWDQTTGSSGDVVNLSGLDSGADSFSTVSYSNNDGTTPWTSNWIESDSNGGGASSGYSSVNAGSLQLQLAAGDAGDNIYREIDLSGATVATLSFDYQNVLSGEDEIRVQVSNNGGGSYSTVQTFSGTANTGSGTASIDISSKIASDTRIRFVVFKNDKGNDLFIDNLAVTYDNGDPLPGGETAFSALTQSSSITVTRWMICRL